MRGLTKSQTKPILKISAGYLMYVEPKNLPGSPVFSLTAFKTQKVILIRESYILLSHSDMKNTIQAIDQNTLMDFAGCH